MRFGSSAARAAACFCVAFVLAIVSEPSHGSESLSSETGTELTLEDAIDHAMAVDPTLHQAQAAMAVAHAELSLATSRRRPRIGFEAGVARTDNPVLVFGQKLLQEEFTQGDFSLNALNQPEPLEDFSGRLSVRQPLYAGGALARSVEAARAQQESSEAMHEAARQELVYRVTDSFLGVLVARQRHAVSLEAVETAEEHARWARDLFNGGLRVESEALQAEARVLELVALALAAEADLAVAETGLNLLLGQPPAAGLELDDSRLDGPPLAAEGSLRTIEDWVAGSHSRADLAAGRHLVLASEIGVRVARSAVRPEVLFEAALEAHDQDFFGASGTNHLVAIGLRLSLFDGGERRARVRMAQARAETSKAALRSTMDRVELETRSAWFAREAARARLDAATQAIEVATRSHEIVEDRYQNGLATLVELLQAATVLDDARVRRLVAARDHHLADTALRLAAGKL